MAEELDNKVPAAVRTEFGKGFARRLRAAGQIPAVIYGHQSETRHVALPAHQVGLLLRKKNAVLDLQIDGKSQLVLVKDVQKDPVHMIIEHIDLVEIIKGEQVTVEVPVHITGNALSGTIVELDVKTLHLQSEAMHIPEFVEVSIEGARPGFKVHVGDVTLPQGVSVIGETDGLVVHVHAPRGVDLGESAEELAADLADDAAHAEHKEELHQAQHDAEKAAAEADAELSGAVAEAEKVVE
jgi:large subunit ribosomal protein L25